MIVALIEKLLPMRKARCNLYPIYNLSDNIIINNNITCKFFFEGKRHTHTHTLVINGN